jgi:hypothetical protein
MGEYIMSGSVYPYHRKLKEWILEDIYAEYEDFKREYPDASDAPIDEFLKKDSEIFNFYWYDLIQNPIPLKLHTTSGEPVLISKAIFEIKDKEAVIKGLPAIKGFEQGSDNFIWYDKRNKEGSATVLGSVEIKGNKLILESNSKKRLERGKKLILSFVNVVPQSELFRTRWRQ